ncbi:hypothetical protein BH11PSE11_BH11PSE11_34200 [soil metagenome]
MRALNIQIQTTLEPTLDVARIRAILDELSNLKPLVNSAIRDEGGEHGLFLNYTFETADIFTLWEQVQNRLLSAPGLGEQLRNCATVIAAREGAGFENYLLLQHFDSGLEVQALS